MEECYSSHAGCRAHDNHSLPSKLLSIQDDSVKLLNTKELQGDKRYVALSYCWGGEQTQKTTTHNLNHREQHGLHIHELPQSLQDAIQVTRNLGLTYLWIDSLCIIQDDAAHKAQEITRMAAIYRGAHLTICAASSASAETGFLGPRAPSAIRKHIVPLQMRCSDGEKGVLYIYRSEHSAPRKQDTINSRGWTLQEHLLSPRLLVYGAWQMRWVCRATQRADGGPGGVYPRSFEGLASKLQSDRTYRDVWHEAAAALDAGRNVKARLCMLEMDDIRSLWARVVEEFTRRKLSVADDRAAAIHGIAMRYGELVQDRYVAGLWETRLAAQLVWKRPSTYDGPTRSSGVRRKPSWSWISVDGAVEWDLGRAREKAVLGVVKCDDKGFGVLGAVDDVPLTVVGRMRPATLYKTFPRVLFCEETFERGGREGDAGLDLALTATATFDYQDDYTSEEAESVAVVYLLEVYSVSNDDASKSDSGPAGIVLQINEIGQYRRVGTFDFEWINAIWMKLYDDGSTDHDARRDAFRSSFFATYPRAEIVLY
jgi:hypothetical protein